MNVDGQSRTKHGLVNLIPHDTHLHSHIHSFSFTLGSQIFLVTAAPLGAQKTLSLI